MSKWALGMAKEKIKLKPKEKKKSGGDGGSKKKITSGDGDSKKKKKKKVKIIEDPDVAPAESEEELYPVAEESEQDQEEREEEEEDEEEADEDGDGEEEEEEEEEEEQLDEEKDLSASQKFKIKDVNPDQERKKGKGGKSSCGIVKQAVETEKPKSPRGGMDKFRRQAAKEKAKRKKLAEKGGDDKDVFQIMFDGNGNPRKPKKVNKKREKKKTVDPRMERSKLLMQALEEMPGPEEVIKPSDEQADKAALDNLYANDEVGPRPPSRSADEENLDKRVAPISFTLEREDGSHAFIKEGEILVLTQHNPNEKWWTGYPLGRVEDTGEFKSDVLDLERKTNKDPMATAPPSEQQLATANNSKSRVTQQPGAPEATAMAEEENASKENEGSQEPENARLQDDPCAEALPVREPAAAPVSKPAPLPASVSAPALAPASAPAPKRIPLDEPEPEPEPEPDQVPLVASRGEPPLAPAPRPRATSDGAVRPPVTPPKPAGTPPHLVGLQTAPVQQASPMGPTPVGDGFQEMLQQGLQCVYMQRFDEAISLFKQCRQVNLTDPTPAYNLACCYSLKRDIDSGIRWLTVAVDLGLDYEDLQQDPDLENMFEDPRFQSIWDRMRNLSDDELAQVDAGLPLSEVRSAHSLTTALTQQYPQALQNDYSRSPPREDSAGSVEGPDTVFESRLQDGVEAVARGDTQEAVRCFESCLRLRPEDAACAYNLTCCHALMGSVDHAVTWFENAVKWGLAEVAGLDPARDPDLTSLMSNAQFQELLQELKQRQYQIESGMSAPAATMDSFAPQTSDANLNSSLGAQSWAAADTSSTTVQGPDNRSFASAPVGYDHRPRPSPEGAPLGYEPAPAWGAHGLEQHPQDVLGNRGVSHHMPGSAMSGTRSAGVPERTSSLRRWQAATHQLPHDPEEWALVHVAHWLKQLGLGKYVEKFEEQDIRGDVLLDLTSAECEQVLGIRVLGHRKLLMKSLEYLRKQSKMDRDAFLAELQG